MQYFVAVVIFAVTVRHLCDSKCAKINQTKEKFNFNLPQTIANADWNVQTQDDFDGYRSECILSLQIPEDNVNEYKMDNFPNDERTQCYVKCMLDKLGLFDDRYGFNVERLVTQLGQERRGIDTKNDIEKCADKNSQLTDVCEWAYRGFYCIRQAKIALRL